jgi:hypothetical protein
VSDLLWLRIADVALATFHLGLTGFNLVGWVWARTRRVHLVTLGATLLSWFGLGVVYGWGYCPLTDWHWQIKWRLGETQLPASFVKYYLDRVTGLAWPPNVVDAAVIALAVAALTLSVALNVRDMRRTEARSQ